MAISLTCSCGARLEIDDKFAGQVIPCPDCQQPLQTATASAETRHLPVSGLALGSLILALVGGFTIVGSLAAIGTGLLAMRQIARAPDKLGGLSIARAGMIVGAVGIFLTLAALVSNEILGIDSLLREYRYAASMDYQANTNAFYTATLGKDDAVGIKRPSPSWGKLRLTNQNERDVLTLVNLREDAHLVCLPFNNAEDLQTARDKAAERLRQSDLFKSLSKPADLKTPSPDVEPKPAADGKEGDMVLELQLGGLPRTFLLRVVKEGADFYLLAGGTRSGRFSRVSPEILRSLDSFKQLDNP